MRLFNEHYPVCANCPRQNASTWAMIKTIKTCVIKLFTNFTTASLIFWCFVLLRLLKTVFNSQKNKIIKNIKKNNNKLFKYTNKRKSSQRNDFIVSSSSSALLSKLWSLQTLRRPEHYSLLSVWTSMSGNCNQSLIFWIQDSLRNNYEDNSLVQIVWRGILWKYRHISLYYSSI